MSETAGSSPRKENKMGTMPVHRLLMSMSVPMMISMLVQAMYNIVDSMFVAGLNEDALSAVSLAFPIQTLMISVAVGTGVGVNSFLSKSLGERNFGDVNKSSVNGLFLSWVSCAVFVIVGLTCSRVFFSSQTDSAVIVKYGYDYMSVICIGSLGIFSQVMFERLLASTGRTFYTMISQSTGAIINIALDPIMIFGYFGFPRLETAGAALATIIGQTVAAGLALYFNLKFNHDIHIGFRRFRPDRRIIGSIYKVGMPAIAMQATGSVMVYAFNMILIGFTSTAAAVFGVYFKLQSFFFMPVFGLNNGMVPIIAYNYGAGNKKRILHTISLSVRYALGFMALGILLFNLIPEALLGLFKASPDMLAIGVPALRIISFCYIFAGFSIILISVLQALGGGLESFYISAGRQFVILIPAAYMLSLAGDVNRVWWAFPIAEFACLLLCLAFMYRTYQKKIKNLKSI